MSKHNLPQNIRELRTQRKFTLRKLSKKLDCSETLIVNWEAGRFSPRLEMLLKLQKVFDITLDDLVYGEIKQDFDSNSGYSVPGEFFHNRT